MGNTIDQNNTLFGFRKKSVKKIKAKYQNIICNKLESQKYLFLDSNMRYVLFRQQIKYDQYHLGVMDLFHGEVR